MHFKIYRDRKKEWRWTLYARNGRKIADSAEGYKRIGKCRKEVEKIQLHSPDAEVVMG